jgi:WD40 repeat protein
MSFRIAMQQMRGVMMSLLKIVAALVGVALLMTACEFPNPKPPPLPTRVPPTPSPSAITVDDAVNFGNVPVRRIGKGLYPQLHWSQDGTRIVANTTSGIYLYDGASLEPLRYFVFPALNRVVALSLDNRLMVTAPRPGESGSVELWDPASGQRLRTLTDTLEAEAEIVAVDAAFSPDGKQITVAGGEWVRQWDAQTGELLRRWKNGDSSDAAMPMWHFVTRADGERLVTVNERLTKLWDSAGRMIVSVPSEPYAKPLFSPDGTALVESSPDGPINILDVNSGRVLRSLNVALEATSQRLLLVSALAISLDGKQLAASVTWTVEPDGKTEHGIALWDVGSGEQLHLFPLGNAEVGQIAFTRDGLYIVSASARIEQVQLWNVSAQKEERVIDAYAHDFDLSPDGKRILTSGWAYGGFRLWDLASGALLRATQRLQGQMNSPVFSPNGGRIAFGVGNDVVICETRTGTRLVTLKGHVEPPDSIIFSRDGAWVASSSLDQTIHVWDAATGALLHSMQNTLPQFIGPGTDDPGRRRAPHISFSPDGRQIASGSFDRAVRVFDVATEKLARTFGPHGDDVTSVAFSPDGQRIASGGEDKVVRIWDVNTGVALTLTGHTGAIWSVAFNSDGTRIVSAGEDGTVRLWNAATGALLQTLSGHSGAVYRAAFSPDGSRIASAGEDKTVRQWDVTTGELLVTDESHATAVESVTFSPDGDVVAASSQGDGTITLWQTP